jgi:hypothetical protein
MTAKSASLLRAAPAWAAIAACAVACGSVNKATGTGGGGGSGTVTVTCGSIPPIQIGAIALPTGTMSVGAFSQTEANLAGQVSQIGAGTPPSFCSGLVGGTWSWLQLNDAATGMNWTLCVSIPGFSLPFSAGDLIQVVAHVTMAMFQPDSVTLTVSKAGAFVAYFADIHTPPNVPLNDLPAGLAIATANPICNEANFGDCNVTSFSLRATAGAASAALAPGQTMVVGPYSITLGRNDRYVNTMGTCQAGDERFTFTAVPKH